MDSNGTTTTYTFADDDPISLSLRNHSGDVAVLLDAAPGTAEVTLRTRRPVDLEPVTASCHRGTITVQVPALADPQGGRGFRFSLGPLSVGVGAEPVHVEAHLPEGADVTARTQRGDVVLQGRAGAAELRSGAGDLRVPQAAAVHLASGAGGVVVGRCTGGVITTGAGDITVETAAGPERLEVRTGSGDVRVGQNHQDATLVTGAGDVRVTHRQGSCTARTGTGDVEVAVPQDVPVWLDLVSGLGQVHRQVHGPGAPAPGQDHLSVSVRTGIGDITVRH